MSSEEVSQRNADIEHRNIDPVEFFSDNMDMLGFSGPGRALVMAVKEAVDNSLDSCEDIEVLPNIYVNLDDCGENEIRLIVEDNGAGIPRDEVGSVFGELLYSSRFGVYKQTRGQQGIGISAIVLWSQKFLNETATVRSCQPEDDGSYEVDISINEDSDEPYTIEDERDVVWREKDHGTRINIPLRANWMLTYKIEEYLKGTSLANPHAEISYVRKGEEHVYERVVEKAPEPPKEIPPHPNIVDMQMLQDLIHSTPENNIWMFLLEEFPNVGRSTAQGVLDTVGINRENPFILDDDQKEELVNALRGVDVPPPSDDALQPLGPDLIETSFSEYSPEYVGSTCRDAIVVDGHPLVVEAGIAYGGDIKESETHRVANRVPLVYDGGACAITKGVQSVDWGLYDIEQAENGEPLGSVSLFVHVCSTSVPFGTEAKTFISQRDKIVREVKLALESCGREVLSYIEDKRSRQRRQEKVQKMTQLYGSISRKAEQITGQSTGDYSISLARSCGVPIVDEQEVRNPTDTPKEVSIGSDTIEISPGDSIESDQVDVEYGIELPISD